MATLSSGARLGVYEITALLGEGGMGEVYRARDTTLRREVALKVLPGALAIDPSSSARFEREARLLASLNHPHIATLFGVERAATVAGGPPVLALAMELVEGVSLDVRIAGGPLPPAEAVRVAIQIADAVAYAHDRGVIHRDLKPANIKVTPDGRVKVLDFGIAKAVDEARSPDASTEALETFGTEAGLVVGTAAYMSPEQARGADVDKRTDVWAFGCVLFEMLTGARAFTGTTRSDLVAAVLTLEPEWARLPATSPPAVRALLRRCLQKDRAQRLRDLGDAKLTLEDAGAIDPAVAASPSQARGPGWARVGILSASLLALGAMGGAFISRPAPSGASVGRRATQLSFSLPVGTVVPDFGPGLALSPDGSTVVYSAAEGAGSLATSHLYMKRLDTRDVRLLAETVGGNYPFFSPDGSAVGFFADRKLKKVDLDTGAVSVVTPLDRTELGSDAGGAATWTPGGAILFGLHGDRPTAGLVRVSSDGGPLEILTRPDQASGEQTHYGPQMLPGTRTVLYTVRSNGRSGLEFKVVAQDLAGGAARTILPGASLARYQGDGRLVYQVGSDLYAATLDVTTLAVSDSRRILEGAAGTYSGASWAMTSDVLVFNPLFEGRRRLTWIDRTGTRTPVPVATKWYQNPMISPDGDRVVVAARDGTRLDYWIVHLAQQTVVPLTLDGRGGGGPKWLGGSGDEVMATRTDGAAVDLMAYRADSAGAGRVLFHAPQLLFFGSASRDGRTVTVMKDGDLWTLDLVNPGSLQPLVQSPAVELGGMISPDGKWVSYFANGSGRDELYVSPFPDGGRRWQVSTGGARESTWSRDGRELFFRSGDDFLVAAVKPGTTFAWDPPRVMFSGRFPQQGGAGNLNYDVAPDGRFLIVEDLPVATPVVQVVLDWPALLH